MFRKTRHPRKETTREEALAALVRNNYGVLATVNPDGDPRATAVNYTLLDDETVIFHSSKMGEKMDNIRQHDKVSFFVVDSESINPGEFTANFMSVAVHGHAEIFEGEAAYPYLLKLTKGLDSVPTDEEIHDYTYPSRIGKVAIVLIHIDQMTGKLAEHAG
ncbi:MAG: pyridoxamine 5'-phosphate oxidase family protein [Streptococcaceae bacterium]|nr:pyridoxamine 5'-phosphate oxidase family protein [Streptococcaceae bacterium]